MKQKLQSKIKQGKKATILLKSLNDSQLKNLATEELLQTPLVQYLISIIQKQDARIEALEAEIRLLKGHPKKPTIKPSRVENANTKQNKEKAQEKNEEKKEKTRELTIHQEVEIEAQGSQGGLAI